MLARVIHVIGNILWLGGGALAAFAFAALAADAKDTRIAAARALRKITLLMVTPGMLLSFAGGVTMLLGAWSTLYAKAPWMHTKLLVGLIAAAFSGVLSGKLRRASTGADVSPRSVLLAGAVLATSAVAGVALVYLRFGQG